MNSQRKWQGNKTDLNKIHAWLKSQTSWLIKVLHSHWSRTLDMQPKYLTSMLIEELHYSLMFWNMLDASKLHVLAENTCNPNSCIAKICDFIEFMNCQEEVCQPNCMNSLEINAWPLLLTSLSLEVSSVRKLLAFRLNLGYKQR